jgi:ribosomal protein S18 acetylase RimI-like enzyme
MLTCKPANPDQHDDFFQLMLDEAVDYLEHTMKLMGLSLEHFRQLFKTVGKVYAIYHNDQLAGFYWIEEREGTLHLHGLVLRKDFQRKGIGSEILNLLETEYASRVKAIELGVHQSNTGARQLYEKSGYRLVKQMPELGFDILQKPIPG